MGRAYASAMLRPLTHMMIRLTLLFGITLGLVGVGFAHRTAAPIDPQLAAFLEVGGTLADVCDDGSPITHWGDAGCEACRLTDTALGAGPFEHRPLAEMVRSFRAVPGQPVNVTQSDAHFYGARAPPVV